MKLLSDREDILTYLTQSHGDLTARYSLERIAVIGSIARGDYDDHSDVDIVVRFRPGTQHIRHLKKDLRNHLEDALDRQVQIISEKYIKPYYRSQVMQEAVDV
jgi:uncharacterized protein